MAKLLDPVCGMTVDDTALRAPGYEDVAFCAPGCRTAFLNNPTDFTDRLDGAEPMPKMCTCGENSGKECQCGHDHGDHADHEVSEAHDHNHDHGTHDAAGEASTEEAAEPVAAGSGCCGGHGH